MKVIKQSDKELSKLEPRLRKFAELLATGTYTKLQAAVKAGFTKGTADKESYRWIGEDRESSYYPNLYDYYYKLNQKNLRKFEAKAESITNELLLIGFSDISKFVDLPSETYEEKSITARKVEAAHLIVSEWKRYEEAKKAYDEKADKRRKEPHQPPQPTKEQIKLLDWFSGLSEKEQHDLMFWLNYSRGSIRLKNREQIPMELMPVVSEISETRDGIRVKLHDKLKALDTLAKILKLYDTKEESEKVSKISAVNIFVNGSKSNLLLDEPE